jgi:hypothetical protein
MCEILPATNSQAQIKRLQTQFHQSAQNLRMRAQCGTTGTGGAQGLRKDFNSEAGWTNDQTYSVRATELEVAASRS